MASVATSDLCIFAVEWTVEPMVSRTSARQGKQSQGPSEEAAKVSAGLCSHSMITISFRGFVIPVHGVDETSSQKVPDFFWKGILTSSESVVTKVMR